LSQGFTVTALDNFDDFYNPALKRQNIKDFSSNINFTLFEGDVRDKTLLARIFSTKQIDCVVHLAARAGVRPSIENPELYYDVNVRGTLMLLESMKNYQIGKLVFASSSSVYGNNTKVPFSETDSVDNPISPYAATKKTGELLCYNYHHLYGFNVYCLRFFTVYGHNQRPEMAIQQFGRLINEEIPVTLFGDGTSRRDYTYIDDIVDGIISAIEKVSGYEIINLGNHETVMLNDLVETIADVLGKKAKTVYKPMQPGDVNITYADINKAGSLLGYKPKHSISDGLEKMFANKFLVV